jgi:hypothetical protein
MASLIFRFKDNPSSLPEVLEEYDDYITDHIQADLLVDGVRLEDLCKHQARKQFEYEKRLEELKTLENFFENLLEEKEGQLWKKYTEDYDFKLSTRDIQAYSKGDEGYVHLYQLMLEVRNIRRKYDAAAKALEALGWQISHITKIRVAELEKVVI